MHHPQLSCAQDLRCLSAHGYARYNMHPRFTLHGLIHHGMIYIAHESMVCHMFSGCSSFLSTQRGKHSTENVKSNIQWSPFFCSPAALICESSVNYTTRELRNLCIICELRTAQITLSPFSLHYTAALNHSLFFAKNATFIGCFSLLNAARSAAVACSSGTKRCPWGC